MPTNTSTEAKQTTEERLDQIVKLVQGEGLHTSEIALSLGLSMPRTRQLIDLAIRGGSITVVGHHVEGRGRPKRLVQAA